MLGDYLAHLDFRQAYLVLLDNVIKLPGLKRYAYLTERLSEHPLDFVIHPFYGLLVSILDYHLVHPVHLLHYALVYLGAHRLRGLLLSLYLHLLGLGLAVYLVVELLLSAVLLLGRVRHRIVHIIDYALMILLLDLLVCGGSCYWVVGDGSRGLILLLLLQLGKLCLDGEIVCLIVVIVVV
jgi:hypothetical protein